MIGGNNLRSIKAVTLVSRNGNKEYSLYLKTGKHLPYLPECETTVI